MRARFRNVKRYRREKGEEEGKDRVDGPEDDGERGYGDLIRLRGGKEGT